MRHAAAAVQRSGAGVGSPGKASARDSRCSCAARCEPCCGKVSERQEVTRWTARAAPQRHRHTDTQTNDTQEGGEPPSYADVSEHQRRRTCSSPEPRPRGLSANNVECPASEPEGRLGSPSAPSPCATQLSPPYHPTPVTPWATSTWTSESPASTPSWHLGTSLGSTPPPGPSPRGDVAPVPWLCIVAAL